MPKPKQTPVQYAEQTLGVHSEQQEALKELTALEEAQEARLGHSSTIRELREQIDQREADLVDEQRSVNPEMSATAFREHMKQVVQQDEQMRDLRQQLRDQQTQYEAVDMTVKQHELRLRLHTSRMDELGGLLYFYGAAKIAAATIQASKESRASEEE